MTKLKITVLKRTVNQDLIDTHMGAESQTAYDFPCPMYEEGQEFISDAWGRAPERFCESAWSDIQKHLHLVRGGGSYPGDWVIPAGAAVACCTDGYRPVVFKIELISDEEEAAKSPPSRAKKGA